MLTSHFPFLLSLRYLRAAKHEGSQEAALLLGLAPGSRGGTGRPLRSWSRWRWWQRAMIVVSIPAAEPEATARSPEKAHTVRGAGWWWWRSLLVPWGAPSTLSDNGPRLPHVVVVAPWSPGALRTLTPLLKGLGGLLVPASPPWSWGWGVPPVPRMGLGAPALGG